MILVGNQPFVYRTAKGLERFVSAAGPFAAWDRASVKNRVEVLWNECGEAWIESASGGGVRSKDHDIGADAARALLAKVRP